MSTDATAAISIVHRGRAITVEAASSDIARRADEMQYELREGPCLQAIFEEETVQSNDLRREDRWPGWSRQVTAELGVRSMLSLPL